MRVSALLGIAIGALSAIVIGANDFQSDGFSNLLSRYRGTDAESAIAAFAGWDELRTQREVGPVVTTLRDPLDFAAVALLHLEADLRRLQLGVGLARPAAQSTTVQSATRGFDAQTLFEERVVPAAKASANEALLQFCRDWYIFRSSLQTGRGPNQLLVDAIGKSFPKDAEMDLVRALHEVRFMGPIVRGDSPLSLSVDASDAKGGFITSGGGDFVATKARAAELGLKRALQGDSVESEARLRLGRLYQVLGRTQQAQKEIEQAVLSAEQRHDLIAVYLGRLFAGELEEQRGFAAAAEGAYRAAVSAFPAGYSARLALGSLLLKLGRTDEGWAMTRTIFGDGQSLLHDPWSRFSQFGYGQIGQRLVSMRRLVSQTPLTALGPTAERALLTPRNSESDASAAPGEGPQFRSRVDSIRVDVLVTNGGKPVEGLTSADFVVTDNGIKQSVDRVATASSLSIALVLDTSSSLNSEDGRKALRTSSVAVQAALRDGDRIAVVTASERIRLRADLLSDSAGLEAALAGVRPTLDDYTALWDGVAAATGLIAEAPGRPLICVVSDGADNASWFSRRRTIEELKRRGVTMDAIQIPWRDPRGVYDFAYGDINLREPGSVSGGIVFDVAQPDLADRVRERFTILRLGYVLSYTPAKVQPQKDGWHEIKVSVRSGLGGKVQARPGYYSKR